jgi:DNA-binding Xre family transcriptional regulator
MISYAPFWITLKVKGISTYSLREKHNVNPNTITRMKNNEYLSLRTIEDLCYILNCDIQDIVIFERKNKENIQ